MTVSHQINVSDFADFNIETLVASAPGKSLLVRLHPASKTIVFRVVRVIPAGLQLTQTKPTLAAAVKAYNAIPEKTS